MVGHPPTVDAAAIRRIGELLRAHGLRRTQPRIAVLATLEPIEGHLSVAEIHRRLIQSAPAATQPPDLATVYRTVTTLVDLGVLHALAVEGRTTTTYGLADNPHHHAICTECRTILEVPAEQLSSALKSAIKGSSFALSEHAGLTLYGLCPQCQAKRRPS